MMAPYCGKTDMITLIKQILPQPYVPYGVLPYEFSPIRWAYHCNSPLDLGWGGMKTIGDFISESLEDVDHNGFILSRFFEGLSLAKEVGWEGDFREPPCVFSIPSDQFYLGFAFKQDNNGSTFILSPVELPWLDDDEWYVNSAYRDDLPGSCPGLWCDQPQGSIHPPIYSANKTADFIEWNGAYLRSEPERVIAEALQRHGLAFHPSHPIRLQINGKWVTREIDFKVILGRNQFAYIEVDGRAYHDSAADDHARDMEFESLTGIRTYRFPAKQCMEDPDGVIEKFLKVTGRGY